MAKTITRIKEFMRTEITVSVVQHPEHSTIMIADAIELAFDQFDQVVKKFTRFNQDSELSNLNRNNGKWAQVSPELFRLVKLMLDMSKKTNGAFDPTVIDFLETYGYDPNYDFSKLDNPDLDNMVRKLSQNRRHWSEIEFDPERSRIKLAEGQRLDLGGIGKGYAIDLAAEVLKDFPDFMVSAGGDIYVQGLNEQAEPWKLALKHKSETGGERVIGVISATNAALTCSGSWARKVKQFHHIIDPITGLPTHEQATVFVTGKTASMADAWATALFVGGKQLLPELPEDYAALLVSEEDKAVMTAGFPKIY